MLSPRASIRTSEDRQQEGTVSEVCFRCQNLPSEHSVTIFEGIAEALYPVELSPVCSSQGTYSSQGSHSSYHLQIAEGDSV